MNKLLSVDKLSIGYDGKNILENISFDVYDGDFLVIFGENGSGKTSLMKVLLGLKVPQSGEIRFDGGLRKNEIGYLPQLTDKQQSFPASAFEVVLSGCLNKMGLFPFYRKKEKTHAKENMKLLGIYDIKDECFRNLSGGQKQRVLLARALCATGKLILLDEPVSGLDPSATIDFYNMICKINKAGVSVIMVSHDVHSSLSVAKHVLKLSNPDFFYGSPAEYENTTC